MDGTGILGFALSLSLPSSPVPFQRLSCSVQVMFGDSLRFNGSTRIEVVAILMSCGFADEDRNRAKRTLVTWIRRKQDKGRNTQYILAKLQWIESKFVEVTALHPALQDARAETFLPRAPDLPSRGRSLRVTRDLHHEQLPS